MQEKRATIRHSFGVEQRIAESQDGQMPASDAFCTVRCVDISPAGFAFYIENRPTCNSLVVELGIVPNVVYLTANVKHFEMIEFCGNLVFRVGCEFTGRAQWSERPENVLRQCDEDSAFRFLEEHMPQQV